MTQRDPVATAMGGVVIGAAAGGAIISLVLFALHETPRTTTTYFNALFAGGIGGLAAAAGIGWLLSRAAVNPLRRAMAAMVALGGAAFVGALTIVVDAAAGRAGLMGLAAVCIILMAWVGRLVAK